MICKYFSTYIQLNYTIKTRYSISKLINLVFSQIFTHFEFDAYNTFQKAKTASTKDWES